MNTDFQVNLRTFAEDIRVKNTILNLLRDCGRMRRIQILEVIPVAPNKIDNIMAGLISKGVIKRDRIGNGVYYYIAPDHLDFGFTPSEIVSYVLIVLSFESGITAKEISDYLLIPKTDVQDALKTLCDGNVISCGTNLGKKTYSIIPDRKVFSVSEMIAGLMSGNTAPNFISLGCKPHASN